MKKIIALATLAILSSSAFAYGGFHDTNNPRTQRAHMRHMQEMQYGGFHDANHPRSQRGHMRDMQHMQYMQHGGFFDESKAVKTVKDAKSAADDTPIMLEGKIVKQIGHDDFIFKDSTGEIEIEVSKRAWCGQEITPNDTIQIFGEVDKEWNKTELDVKRIIKK